jgi:hypothetical protein
VPEAVDTAEDPPRTGEGLLSRVTGKLRRDTAE